MPQATHRRTRIVIVIDAVRRVQLQRADVSLRHPRSRAGWNARGGAGVPRDRRPWNCLGDGEVTGVKRRKGSTCGSSPATSCQNGESFFSGRRVAVVRPRPHRCLLPRTTGTRRVPSLAAYMTARPRTTSLRDHGDHVDALVAATITTVTRSWRWGSRACAPKSKTAQLRRLLE